MFTWQENIRKQTRSMELVTPLLMMKSMQIPIDIRKREYSALYIKPSWMPMRSLKIVILTKMSKDWKNQKSQRPGKMLLEKTLGMFLPGSGSDILFLIFYLSQQFSRGISCSADIKYGAIHILYLVHQIVTEIQLMIIQHSEICQF